MAVAGETLLARHVLVPDGEQLEVNRSWRDAVAPKSYGEDDPLTTAPALGRPFTPS
jgi:hypothetical protein